MTLVHFTLAEAIEDRPPVPQRGGNKPDGLWVSDESAEDSWSSWNEQESYVDLSVRQAFAVTVREDRILVLADVPALDAFTAEYGTDLHRYKDDDAWAMDWARVAERYDGILITPYQWERRLTAMWYYTWDCASGCIWNMDAIATIEQIERVKS